MSMTINPKQKLTEQQRAYLKDRGREDLILLVDKPKEFAKQRDMSPEELAAEQERLDAEAKGKRTPSLLDNEMIQAQREQAARVEEDQLYATSEEFDQDDVAFVNSCTVTELKEHLKSRSLPTNGTKPELQNRLLNALKKENEQEQERQQNILDDENENDSDQGDDGGRDDENQS